MPEDASFDDAHVQRFEEAWQKGGSPPNIDDFLPRDGRDRLAVLSELCKVDKERRLQARLPAIDYPRRYPELAAYFNPTQNYDACQPAPASDEPAELPAQIGRYRVERLLGRGGFGLVYLAHHEQLSRPVAIKVPHRHLVARREDAEAYLTEARIVAALDHPNIVPVYDAGSTREHPFFVVSKFIEGSTLTRRIKEKRPAVLDATELVAKVAETLHYAHGKGLVHRDIKPGNILLEWRAGDVHAAVPYIADFGLALKEENLGRGPKFAGTLAYTSPEQARGEGHRVDGRSDIFSLGVVFYQLLTGRRPFHAEAASELLDQITSMEVRPPRQWVDTIPRELERICLKALAKRASERYMTAKDLADDLRHFLEQSTDAQKLALSVPAAGAAALPDAPAPSTPLLSATPPEPVKIVPKGLRSFDNHDADFFLELVPGPRDREGLPDSIRFWKTKIEETDEGNTFAVGLIYGPSGCGKSSLVKAGLLPRLRDDVIAVYVEATAGDTEARLLAGLRRQCPALAAHPRLKDALAAVRRGQGIAAGKKVLIVLDQFEQWLHAQASRERQRPEPERPESERPEPDNSELVEALRQCDGRRLQSIVMVRDDFWLAVSRFLKELEVRLLEGQNSALVDLFDPDHARKVLALFGRAFGKLPENARETSPEQKRFLELAVADLTQEGKVICVRLALFAEMMKGKTWTPASLKAVGGTTGVRVTFLEETFSASTAPPEHRYHQKAARGVLNALLPESGTDLKGLMRSYQELLEASGYRSRPKDFDDLLRILDSELRLITPTDPEGKVEAGSGKEETETSESSRSVPPAAVRYYQLTHDYLVPSLRDWLTRKQKETTRGRAELLLEDRAALWNARPETRQLPSLLQWANVRFWTRKETWTPPQQKMMHKAGRYHAVRILLVALVLALAAWGSYEAYGTMKAHALRDELLSAHTENVLKIVKDMAPYRRWINPLLRDAYEKADPIKEPRKKLHASIALLSVNSDQVGWVYGGLLDCSPQDLPVLCEALDPYKRDLLAKLWTAAEQPAKDKKEQRLRAACALARYDPHSQRWTKTADAVVDDFVSVPPIHLERWMDSLSPVHGKLQRALEAVFRAPGRTETERTLAANILADYAANQPQLLAELLMDADTERFGPVYLRFKEHGEAGLDFLEVEMAKQPAQVAGEDARDRLRKRQANAAVAILRMDRPAEIWPLLKWRPDPTLRSHLIHRLGPLGADAGEISTHVRNETDLTIRRALILSLGEFKDSQVPERPALIKWLLGIYEKHPDAGLHAAAEWLLGAWGQHEKIKAVDDRVRMKEEQIRNQFQRLHKELAERKPPREKTAFEGRWYISPSLQTMVVIPGPVQFVMGSPPGEAGRRESEAAHTVRIKRTFAIGARAVTVGEYRRFHPKHLPTEEIGPVEDYPVTHLSWFEAAAYCNRLSEVEGIDRGQWCYDTNTEGKVTSLRANYLSLTGYRLPTEAEMEFATRAGASTSRYYGDSEELLVKYGWFVPNCKGRVGLGGRLKPNDLGLFDMHGNVWCWCQEDYRKYRQGESGQVFDDQECDLEIDPEKHRVLRGGCYTDHAPAVRCARRWHNVPTLKTNLVGFRLARTLATD